MIFARVKGRGECKNMSLDMWANYGDILAVRIGIVGVVLIVRQLTLARQESEREHQRRKNEMTLN